MSYTLGDPAGMSIPERGCSRHSVRAMAVEVRNETDLDGGFPPFSRKVPDPPCPHRALNPRRPRDR